jgi:hypothetical protein
MQSNCTTLTTLMRSNFPEASGWREQAEVESELASGLNLADDDVDSRGDRIGYRHRPKPIVRDVSAIDLRAAKPLLGPSVQKRIAGPKKSLSNIGL